MNRLLETHQPEIVRLCRKYRVKRLELFGSATRNGEESDIGDIDLLVEFSDLNDAEYADAYFGLLESLWELFQKPVDLVMPSAINNPYFMESIQKSRMLLYAA